MSTKRILGLAIAASTLAPFAALAATRTRERVCGTIASATADPVTVDTYADKPVTVALIGKTTHFKAEKLNQCRYTPRVYKRAAPSVGPAISPGWPEWFSE
jgi:hypothetical protein